MIYTSAKKNVALLSIISLFCVTLSAQVAFQETSFSNAQIIIEEEKLPYIIYFYGDWCPSCQLMEETTFKDKKVNKRIEENYVVFKVNADSERGKEWMGIYGITSVPTTLFYNKDSYLLNKLDAPITATDFLKITADLGKTSVKSILSEPVAVNPQVPKKDLAPTQISKKRKVNRTPKKPAVKEELSTIIAAIDTEIQELKGLMGNSEKLTATTNTLNTLPNNNNPTAKEGNIISNTAAYPSIEVLTSQIAACKSLLSGHKNIQRLVDILEDYKLLLGAIPQKRVLQKEILVANTPKQMTKKAVVTTTSPKQVIKKEVAITTPSKQTAKKATAVKQEAKKSAVVTTPYKITVKKGIAKKVSNYQRLYSTNQQIIKYLKLAPPVKQGNQFIVQIGQYQNVRNAERLVQNIQDKYDYPIKVHIQKQGDKPIQMVYLGEFKTKEEAIAANENLKWINRKGVVKQF